jgi:hypothetical protein
MARRPMPEIDANATAAELVDALDPIGVKLLAGKLSRIETELMPLSRRNRLLILNALLRAELDAARAAEGRRA